MDGANGSDSQERVDVLYSEILTIYVRSKNKEERQRKLRVTIERLAGLRHICSQVLCITLTDDEDPAIIYSIKIAEDDFKLLKNQQGLLVDFENFVEHLVRLLDQCLHSTELRFIAVLSNEGTESSSGGRKTSLQIIERTQFKNLCHLLLDVNDASDADIMKHMANTIKKLKEEVQSSNKQLSAIQIQLNDTTRKLEIKTDACDKIFGKCMEEKDKVQLKLTQQLIAAKENYSKAQIEWQKNFELEKQCLVDKYEDMVKQLETQVTSFKVQIQGSHEKESEIEFTNRELKTQLESMGKEKKNLQMDVNILRRQNSQLDKDYHEKERVVQTFRTRFALLEQEVRAKTEMLVKQQEAAKALSEQKKILEGSLLEKEMIIQRQNASLQTISADFIKANEILNVHQAELITVKAKLQLSTNVALEQEKVLQLRMQNIDEMVEQNRLIQDANNKKLQELEEERQNLKKSLLKTDKILEDKERRIKLNEDVIDRLNRRLNETYSQQITGPSNPWNIRRPHVLDTRPTSPQNIPYVTPTFVHSSLGVPTKFAAGTHSNTQMLLPIRTNGPPQKGFGHTPNNGGTSSGSVVRGGERDSQAGNRQVNNSSSNGNGPEVAEVPSADVNKQTVRTSEMSSQYQRSAYTFRKKTRGILRNSYVKPDSLSAYFSNAEGK